MYSTPQIVAIRRCCSLYDKLLLRAIVATFQSLGFEEARLWEVLPHLDRVCSAEGRWPYVR